MLLFRTIARRQTVTRIILPILLAVNASVGKCQTPAVAIPADDFGTKYQLIGRTGKPLGTIVTLQGIVVAGFPKGYDDGANVLIQRIDGVATQNGERIKLTPWLYEIGETVGGGYGLPKLHYGATYEFEGFETGEFVGQPAGVTERTHIPIQTSGFHFHHHFKVFRAKRIEPLAFSPGEFVDRTALIQGNARSIQGQSWIEGKGWRLLTADGAFRPWMEGKPAEALGRIRKTNVAGEFRVEAGAAHLTRLDDQVGHQVELRGTPLEWNDVWWFDYRGVALYVEKMERLPDWTGGLRGSSLLIRGRLEKAMLSDLSEVGAVEKPRLKEQFILRNASWSPTAPLLSPEQKYDTHGPIEGGPVPALIPPSSSDK